MVLEFHNGGVEGGADHEALEGIEGDGEVGGNSVNAPYFCFEFPDNLEFFLGMLRKKTVDLAVEFNGISIFDIHVGFEKNCLVLVVVVRPISNWDQPRIVELGILLNL